MKRFLGLLILLAAAHGVLNADFYDPAVVQDIRLYFAQSNWDTILDQLYAAGEERLLGTAVINGVTYDSVGVRYKGNSSYNASRVKNPFNIKLDYVIEDQNIDGYTTIKLANGFSDPSFIRETLGYEIARKYMPASKANYANVYVNNVRIGIYTNDQDIDDDFGDSYFNCGSNVRIKGIKDDPGLWNIWGYINANESSYTNYYELDSGANMTPWINFLYTFNNNSTQMESVFNVDRHLWNMGFDWLTVNLDAPVNFGHNFYAIEDYNHRFNTVLWDLNMCFGGFTQLFTGGNLTVTQMQQLSVLTNYNNSSYPILNKVLTNSRYQRMYVAHIRTMIEENFSNGWYSTRASQLQALVGPYVQTDTNFFYTYANFTANLNSAVSGGSGGPGGGTIPGITQLMGTRATYLLSHTPFSTGTVPSITSIAYSPTTINANSNVTFTMQTTSATTAYLGWRQNANLPFTRVQMYDDGAHGDGGSGDGRYGVTIVIGIGDIQYFGYAENASQGRFLPARAEYEYYTADVVATIPTLKINEIQAKNTLVTDENSEYDDWVEIYNPTSSAVNIGGMYMVDNHYSSGVSAWTQIPVTNPTLTTIPAGGYKILWFDEQPSQGVLHINNKLGGPADAVYLIAGDASTVVDSYSWTAATGMDVNNVSMGRVPNGGSTWMLFGVGQSYGCTPGAANPNAANTPPSISNITYSPKPTTNQDPVTIFASITDTDGTIASATLVWSVDGGTTTNNVLMTHVGSTYSASVGPYANGTEITYYIRALDDMAVPTTSLTYSITVGYVIPELYINEVMPVNTITQTDEVGEYEDWAEIYNPNSFSVDLAGCYIVDDHYGDTTFTMTRIPYGQTALTTIPEHGFKIIWFDEETTDGPLHINTKLGTATDHVYLIAPDMLTIIDHVFWTAETALASDVSFGRIPSGGNTWTLAGTGQATLSSPGTGIQIQIPQSVQLTSNANGGSINWNPVTYAASYYIYRSELPYPADWGIPIAQVTTANWTDTEASTNTRFFYKIVASTDIMAK
jgi:hypothetical protein